ncbi:MAG: sporulation transcription factor Spo0A [Erysipelotrichales bacterium]|nr:sporulation transcription factor Spo0A [Erysipelotrichales bacterium]
MEKIRIFVADDNPQYVDFIVSSIARQPNMYVVDSASDGEEALSKLKKCGTIDVLIVDMIMPNLDGYALLKQINDGIEGTSVRHIICISALVNERILSLISTLGGDMFVIKPFTASSLLDAIQSVLESDVLKDHKFESQSNGESIEKRLSDLLHEMGVPAHIKGYNYLRTGILLTFENQDEYIGQITKSLYPEIAKRYKSTSSRVERAIRHAIEIAWNRGNIDLIDEIFGYSINAEKAKPTNSEFIVMIADYLAVMKKNAVMMH